LCESLRDRPKSSQRRCTRWPCTSLPPCAPSSPSPARPASATGGDNPALPRAPAVARPPPAGCVRSAALLREMACSQATGGSAGCGPQGQGPGAALAGLFVAADGEHLPAPGPGDAEERINAQQPGGGAGDQRPCAAVELLGESGDGAVAVTSRPPRSPGWSEPRSKGRASPPKLPGHSSPGSGSNPSRPSSPTSTHTTKPPPLSLPRQGSPPPASCKTEK
jgi:hypothetical protein